MEDLYVSVNFTSTFLLKSIVLFMSFNLNGLFRLLMHYINYMLPILDFLTVHNDLFLSWL